MNNVNQGIKVDLKNFFDIGIASKLAKILGVSIRTLRNKINEYRNNGNAFFVNLR